MTHHSNVLVQVLKGVLKISYRSDTLLTFVYLEPSDIDAVTCTTSVHTAVRPKIATHLLVHLDVYLHTLLGLALEQAIQTPFWKVC